MCLWCGGIDVSVCVSRCGVCSVVSVFVSGCECVCVCGVGALM